MVAAGVSGALAPLAFIGAVVLAGAQTAGYSPVEQAISELFATGTDTATLVGAGMLAFSVLALPMAVVLVRAGLGWTGGALLLDAVGTAVIVAFPCSPGCPGPGESTTDLLHIVVAGIAYLGHLSAPLLAAREVDADGAWAWLGRLGLVLGIPALLVFGAWVLGLTGTAGGLGQRTFTILVDVWIVSAGVAVARAGLRRA